MPLTAEPEEKVPDVDEPDGAVELMLSVRDGELVLRPLPLELVAPLPAAPEGPEPPDVLVPDVLGDADGV